MQEDWVHQEIKKAHTVLRKLIGEAGDKAAHLAAINKGQDLQSNLATAIQDGKEFLASMQPLLDSGCNEEETWAPFKD